MDRQSHGKDDGLLLSARLRPHRSLPRGGFIALMAVAGASAAFSIVLFAAMHAWPISAFCGLDMLGLCIAFRINYAAAQACEEIEVSYSDITVRRISRRGAAETFRFNPAWARMVTQSLDDEGMVLLALTSHGNMLVIGQFLSPGERSDFAAALKRALFAARENRVAATVDGAYL